MFNIYGFVTTPAASLILFSALFLLVYQRYLADNSWKNALLMGLTMALMIFSKYHAFLLLGLIVLSNLKRPWRDLQRTALHHINDEIEYGKHLFNLGIGDRISSFVTEESGMEIRIVP